MPHSHCEECMFIRPGRVRVPLPGSFSTEYMYAGPASGALGPYRFCEGTDTPKFIFFCGNEPKP